MSTTISQASTGKTQTMAQLFNPNNENSRIQVQVDNYSSSHEGENLPCPQFSFVFFVIRKFYSETSPRFSGIRDHFTRHEFEHPILLLESESDSVIARMLSNTSIPFPLDNLYWSDDYDQDVVHVRRHRAESINLVPLPGRQDIVTKISAFAASMIRQREDNCHKLHMTVWIKKEVVVPHPQYQALMLQHRRYYLRRDHPAVAAERGSRNTTEVEQCSICMEEMTTGSHVTGMPCSHMFHRECIQEWLKRSNTCPICRYRLPTRTELPNNRRDDNFNSRSLTRSELFNNRRDDNLNSRTPTRSELLNNRRDDNLNSRPPTRSRLCWKNGS